MLRQTNNEITSKWQKEKIIREEKTAELDSVQDELHRVQRDFSKMRRAQETLAKQNEDKENTISQLKKDLRSTKKQLNEENIRLRRSQVMQSRIPVPTNSTRKPLPPKKVSGLMKPSMMSTASRHSPPTRANGPKSKSDTNMTDTSERKTNDPNNVARIKYRVLKMLQVHDPAKADRIDILMSKFEGRETELLEKMITKYESGKEESNFVATTAQSTESTDTLSSCNRPQSRQDKALERHMERMKRIKAQAVKD